MIQCRASEQQATKRSVNEGVKVFRQDRMSGNGRYSSGENRTIADSIVVALEQRLGYGISNLALASLWQLLLAYSISHLHSLHSQAFDTHHNIRAQCCIVSGVIPKYQGDILGRNGIWSGIKACR